MPKMAKKNFDLGLDALEKQKITTITGLFSSKLFSKNRKPVLCTKLSRSRSRAWKNPSCGNKKRRIENKDEIKDVEERGFNAVGTSSAKITEDYSPCLDSQCEVTDMFSSPIDVKLSYIHQIHVNGAMSLYGVLPDIAILRHFDVKTLKLSFNRHVIVKRRALNFSNGAQWIYSCSCQSSDVDFVASLNNVIFSTYEDFVKQTLINKCIHIDVVMDLISKSDALNNISAEDGITENEHSYAAENLEDCIIGNIPGSCVVIYDSQTKSHGVVMPLKQILWCSVCASSYCVHVHIVKKLQSVEVSSEVKYILEELNEKQEKPQWTPICFSKKKISFERDGQLALRLGNLSSKLAENDVLRPQEKCLNCQSVNGEYSSAEGCPIITSNYVYKNKVSTWTCQSCFSTMIYDGHDDGILNMGSYMVSHELMRSYLHGFLHGKRTLAAFFHELKERQFDHGELNFESHFSYNKLKEAWYNYVKLLDIDYENGFCCNLCGHQPDTIVCDGTTLGFRQQMLKVNVPEKSHDEILTGSSFQELVLIGNPTTRRLLNKYSKGKTATQEDFNNLVKLLEETLPEVAAFVKESHNGSYHVKPEYKDILASVSSPSPVAAFIPPNAQLINSLRHLVSNEDISAFPDDWKALQELCPILFKFLSNKFPLEKVLIDFISLIMKKSLDSFENKNPHPHGLFHQSDQIGCFPSLRGIRSRGLYEADKKKEKIEKCKKSFLGHPSLLPGIFTIFCKHGVCYGFEVMQNHESPNVPFSILKTRFETAPSVVIYDFACSLHKYCLRRDPVFFKNTRFYVDRFHWKNHTGCSKAYCLDLYTQFSKLNSQVNEQANSSLKRIKDQVSYMTQENFIIHCRLYLYNRNLGKCQSIE